MSRLQVPYSAALFTWQIKALMMILPLTIIGGFLGAGKTTLLKHLLENADGRRLAVLINDFGALNIDAALIKSTGANSIELSNGCVCCSLGDDLVNQLVFLEKSADKFDHVVIEASGVGDPWKIAQIGMVAGAYRLDSVIVVVDTETIENHITDELTGDTVIRQLARADIVLANKSDLTNDAQRTKIRDLLNPHLDNNFHHWIECVHGQLDINLALGDYSWNRSGLLQNSFSRSLRPHKSLPPFSALSFTHSEVQTRDDLQALFNTLSVDVWSKLLRGKAIFKTKNGWIEWHKMTKRETWIEHTGTAPSATQLVLISRQRDESITENLIKEGWSQC
jgi:G3E family GTPase